MNNRTGVSALLLRINSDLTGGQQFLKASTAITLSMKDAEKQANSLGISLERLQEMANARIEPSAIQGGLLGRLQNGQAVADGFLRDLEKIQSAEQSRISANERLTEQLKKQSDYLKDQEQSTQRQSRGIRDIGMQRIPEPSLSDFGVQGGGRSVPGTLNTVRDTLIAAPGIGYQNPAVVALRGISTLADKTGASFGQLGTALGIAGVAVVGVALAMDGYNRGLQEQKKALEAALAAQQRYYQLIGQLTQEQADEQIAELQRQRPALEQRVAENRAAVEQFFAELSTSVQEVNGIKITLGDPIARAVFAVDERAKGLQQALDDSQQELSESINLETRLTQGRASGAFAANDMRAAEEELAKQRTEYAQYFSGLIKNDTDEQLRQVALRQEIDKMTTEQREQARQQAERDLLLVNARLSQGELLGNLTIEAGAQLSNQQGLLLERISFLSEITETFADIQDRATKAREAEMQAIEDELALIQKDIDYNVELSEQVRTSTVEQVADRLAGLEDERHAIVNVLGSLKELAPTSKEAADQLAAAQARLLEIGKEYQDQIVGVLPAAIARAEAQRFTEEGKARQASAAKIREIEQQRTEKEAEAVEKRESDIAKLRTKSAKDLGEALAKIQEDSDERIAKLSAEGKRTIQRAIADGDQAAAIEALEDLEYNIQQEEQQAAKAEIEKRKEIDKRLEEQLQVVEERYREQVDAARNAAEKAKRVEAQRLREELDEKAAAYREQLALLEAFRIQSTATYGQFVDGMNAHTARLMLPASGGAYPSQVTTISHGTNDRYADTSRFPSVTSILEDQARRNGTMNSTVARQIRGAGGFDEGGYNTRSGFFYSGVPEYHIPIADVNRFSSNMGSQDTYNININGSKLDEQALKRAVAVGIQEAKAGIIKETADGMARIQRQRRG